MARDLAGLFAVSGVEGGLAAAGLGLPEIDLVADALQHLGHGETDLGKDLIDDAGDEQRDTATRHELRLYGENRQQLIQDDVRAAGIMARVYPTLNANAAYEPPPGYPRMGPRSRS